MNSRSPEDMDMQVALKVTKAAIRLKHSVAADREINTKIPQLERQIRRYIEQGKAWRLLPETGKVVEDNA